MAGGRNVWRGIVAALVVAVLSVRGLDTVEELDLLKYVGRWYLYYSNEFTLQFQTGSDSCITADYTLEADGSITVFNSGRIGGVDGAQTGVNGMVTRPDASEQGKLIVDFGFFRGDYWVYQLGPVVDGYYQYAIVSGAPLQQLYVIVRDPAAFKGSDDDSAAFVFVTEEMGFAPEEVLTVPQKKLKCLYSQQPEGSVITPGVDLVQEDLDSLRYFYGVVRGESETFFIGSVTSREALAQYYGRAFGLFPFFSEEAQVVQTRSFNGVEKVGMYLNDDDGMETFLIVPHVIRNKAGVLVALIGYTDSRWGIYFKNALNYNDSGLDRQVRGLLNPMGIHLEKGEVIGDYQYGPASDEKFMTSHATGTFYPVMYWDPSSILEAVPFTMDCSMVELGEMTDGERGITVMSGDDTLVSGTISVHDPTLFPDRWIMSVAGIEPGTVWFVARASNMMSADGRYSFLVLVDTVTSYVLVLSSEPDEFAAQEPQILKKLANQYSATSGVMKVKQGSMC